MLQWEKRLEALKKSAPKAKKKKQSPKRLSIPKKDGERYAN